MIDGQGQVLWQFGLTAHIYEARPVSSERFLISDTNNRQVSERDAQGNIVWKCDLGNYGPLSAQRLRNGNTFIAGRNQIIEVDRAGKEVMNLPRFNDYMMAALNRGG